MAAVCSCFLAVHPPVASVLLTEDCDDDKEQSRGGGADQIKRDVSLAGV